MRTTITIDDQLFEDAVAVVGVGNASTVVTKALELLVSTESTRRLLSLSGKAPAFTVPERSQRTGDRIRYEGAEARVAETPDEG